MFEPIQRIWQRAKIAKRLVFGQSQIYSSWGYQNVDEPTPRRQRQDYRGLFFKCVNIRASQIASAMEEAKVVRVLGQDEHEEVEYDHPWAKRLRKPVPDSHSEDFWEWVSLSRDLIGHAHSLVDDFDTVMGADLPTGFLPIYSEFGDLNPIPNAKGGVSGWQFIRSDGQKKQYDPNEVLAIGRTSPYNPYKTMSLIQAAIHELDVDQYMKEYRKDSVKEGGITSDIISTEQQMNQPQRDRLSQEFKEFKGKRGHGKVLALSHGMDLVKTSMDARDLQYIEGNVQNANDLKFITGIPEALYAKDANRAVLEGAERVMIQYTIQPEVDKLCKQVTSEFERIYGADEGKLMVMPPDLTPIDEALEIKRRESYLRTGQRTIDEYRQKDGKEEYDNGIGDVPMVGFSQVPLEEAVTLNDQFKGDPPPSEEDDEEARAVKKKASRDVDLDYEWRKIDQHRQREEKKTAASINLVFDKLEEIAQSNIDNRRHIRAEKPIISIEQVLSVIEAEEVVDEELRDDIVRLIREGFRRGALSAQVQGLEFQMSTPQVRELMRDVAGKTKGIASTTIDELSESIEEGISSGEDLDSLSDRVSEYFTDAKQRRTKMIAQTMTTSSFEGGQLISFREAGAVAKSWLSQRDGSVRNDHEIADQQQNEIPLNQKFNVGGAKLRFPGDPQAPAKQTIYCRCSMLPVMNVSDDE
jgi:HK97 family phage portal protein